MSDARETAICCFKGITNISERDFQMLLVVKIGYVRVASTSCTRLHKATTKQKIMITKIRNNDH